MRLGTTSYIYPDHILPNVLKLADAMDDIELVLFEVDEGPNNLPDETTMIDLRRTAIENDVTYTVHLPVDLRLADDRNESSLEKAVRVIRHTEPLSPRGFIIHLQSSSGPTAQDEERFVRNSVNALERLLGELSSPERLCVENLEHDSEQILEAVLSALPISTCIDIGHLWKSGRDPVPYLEKWLPRARVVHLHGVKNRDHEGMASMPAAWVDKVTERLIQGFDGVLTIEVFRESDLLECLNVLAQSMERQERGRRDGKKGGLSAKVRDALSSVSATRS
ncbi:MAG: cobamide remodeling phosphodiesterase CbiR [Deltaproteobacteria bacterium]